MVIERLGRRLEELEVDVVQIALNRFCDSFVVQAAAGATRNTNSKLRSYYLLSYCSFSYKYWRVAMLSTTARSLLRMQRLKRPGLFIPPPLWPRNDVPRRNLSVRAIYSSFPASLLRYSSRPKSSLFDVKDLELRVDDSPEDAVRVSGDGLVYPGVAEGSSCNDFQFSHKTRTKYLTVVD